MAKPIIPTWKKQDERGDWIFGLGAEDIERIRQGYGCPRCLEPFETPVAVCPVCREPQGITSDFVIVPTPEDWVTALKERS
jgi:predicted amidophosphoribosyltransferase